MAEFDQDVMFIPPRDKSSSGVFSDPSGYKTVNGKLVPKYPLGDLSTGSSVLSALGSYWARQFGDKGKLLRLYRASSILAAQTYINYLETIASTSRHEVPVFHRRVWYAIVLRESKLNMGAASMLKYGVTAGYDGLYQYGGPVTNEFQSVDLTNISRIGVIFNKIVDPSVTWVNGVDFFVDTDGSLLFRNNPFKESTIPVKNIFNNAGEIIDREVVLWAFSAMEDWKHIYEHFGYVIRYKTASSDSYKDLVNSIWNGLVGGLSTFDFEWALAAIAGLPVAKEVSEVVEAIIPQPKKTTIVTNKHAYIYPAGSISKVSVNDTVYAGQILVDTVRVFDLANFDDIISLLSSVRVNDAGKVVTKFTFASSSSASMGAISEYRAHRSPSRIKPPDDDVPMMLSLPIAPGLLAGDYSGPIGFENLVGDYDQSKKDANGVEIGKITGVQGSETDVDLLWNTAHNAGVAAGQTWMQKLGIPLPAYVNPAGFAIEHFLRNNALVVYLRYTKFGTNALGLELLKLLRKVLPPEKVVIYLVDVDITEDETIDTNPPCLTINSSSSAGNCEGTDFIAAESTEDRMTSGEPSDFGSSSSSSFAPGFDQITDTVQEFYPVFCP